MRVRRKIGYADPPYVGCAHLYPEKTEVDMTALVARLECDFDGWILHAAATPRSIATLAPLIPASARWMAWVKPFAAFKRNVSVAYAWEPIIVKPVRKPVVTKRVVMRDFIAESITLRRGFTGAKPEKVCHWAFEMLGAKPSDRFFDLYPGSGAVTRAWNTWLEDVRTRR